MESTPLQLQSPAFRGGGMIPADHTCEGADRLPELRWRGAPEGTRSFVILVEDPDAPGGSFTHWVRYDIPPTLDGLRHDRAAGLGGTNDFATTDWRGPCPPPDHGGHRYFFRLFALDLATLDLPRGASIEQVRERMAGHVLGAAELMGRYRRSTR